MALAFVQVQNNRNALTGQTSLTVSIPSSAGNLLIAYVRQSANNTDTMLVSDSAGNTWTQTASGYVSAASGRRGAMFFTPQNVGSVTSVTVTFSTSGGVANPSIVVIEISGAAASAI